MGISCNVNNQIITLMCMYVNSIRDILISASLYAQLRRTIIRNIIKIKIRIRCESIFNFSGFTQITLAVQQQRFNSESFHHFQIINKSKWAQSIAIIPKNFYSPNKILLIRFNKLDHNRFFLETIELSSKSF